MLKIKRVYHYGNARNTIYVSLPAFLEEMAHEMRLMPDSKLREKVARDCITDVLAGEKGEYGWNTYSIEIEGK